jgi:hypothetical protein
LLNGVPALQSQTSLYNYYSGGAGNLTGTGNSNTANGYQALSANTTGSYNTANGYQALSANTTGISNTANGYQALSANTTGSYNTANGFRALSANTTGNSNTANGYRALLSNTTGSNNTANGYAALFYNTTGSNNTANGMDAGQYIAGGVTANQASSNSVYEGYQAYPLASGDTNENVIGNTAIGHGSNTTTLGAPSVTGFYVPGIAASSATSCLQISTTGSITNTGSACGGGGGTVAAYVQTNVGSPAAPTSTTATMQGLAASITPTVTGVVDITVSGYIQCGTLTVAGDGIIAMIRYGTGTAPINGAAQTGTGVVGNFMYVIPAAAISNDTFVPFSTTYIVPGLTVGTAYWIDLQAAYIGATGCRFQAANVTARELH